MFKTTNPFYTPENRIPKVTKINVGINPSNCRIYTLLVKISESNFTVTLQPGLPVSFYTISLTNKIMTKDILSQMTATANKLLQTISSFPSEKFNTIPFEGSWTAAQVSDHILKFVSGVQEMLYTSIKPTMRQPDEKAEAIKAMFLNFDTKMKSPEFVLPENSVIEKEKILTALENITTKITEAIETLDLSATCTVFELPGFGEFTRAEWIWFAIYHTQRHTHQLKNIYEVLVNKKQLVK